MMLEDVSVNLTRPLYNFTNGVSYFDASLTSQSVDTYSKPLRLVVNLIQPTAVTVLNADGLTENGQPYYEMDSFLGDGQLVPGEVSASRRIELSNPDRLRFTIDLRVWADEEIQRPPVANAGPDQTVPVGVTVCLDGSGSIDPDGDPLTFYWQLLQRPLGSSAILDHLDVIDPCFFIDIFGAYTIELFVNDGALDSTPDQVVIDTENSPPVAKAGPDQTATLGTRVSLDGSGSSDVDGQVLTYNWVLAVPTGSAAILDDPQSVTPAFTIDLPGNYVATLKVSDGQVESAPDSVSITTENSTPVACTGDPQSVLIGDDVQLDGRCSIDPDGDALTYSWSLTPPTGSAAALDDPTIATPSFLVDLPGTYIAQLVVNDGKTDSLPVTVAVSTGNSRPIADPGPDQTADVGDTVGFDGSNSRDADGDDLTYQWSLLTLPQGSGAKLAGAVTATPSFVADLAGLYVVQLIVHDGQLGSEPGTAKVTVQVGNQPPAFTSTAPTATIIGVEYSYTADAIDPEGGAVTYSLTEHPAGMTVDPTSGVVTWTAAAAALGAHSVTLQAADPQGGSAIQQFVLSVYLDCTTQPPGSPGACGITSLSTDSAQPGTELLIQGYGFESDPANNNVKVGGIPTQVIAAGAGGISVRVPLTATGGAVTVQTPRGTMTGPDFTVSRAQEFALVASPAATQLLQGSRRAVQIEVGDTGSEPFTDAVGLTAGSLPSGISLEFLPPSLTVGRKGTVLVAAAEDAPPGLYTIEIQGSGYTSGIRQTRTTAFTLQIQPDDGSATGLIGRFVTPEGAGIPGVIVRAEPVGAYGTSLGQTVTDVAGDFELRDLPAGILVLRIDATPADPGYPIFPVSATVMDGVMSRFDDWVLRHQPPDERFTPIVSGSPQEQVITDPRYPGLEVRLAPGTSIVGWDGVPKTRMAIERIEPDRLPVDPPLVGANSYFQLFFGTPMGGVPSSPVEVTLPNELGLDPGQKAELWYFDGAPTGDGLWKSSGTGTVSADGSVIVTDPGSGIPRFCGVCGLSCFIRQGEIPNPPCPDCDPQGPPQQAGKPVTLALGQELPSVVDLQIDGVMPITIGRVYNPWNHFVNNAQLRPSFGHGWYASYDVGIYGVGNVLRVVMPGNGRVDFQPDGSGDYTAPGDLRFGGARLTSQSGSLEIVFKDGRIWRFSPFGIAGALGTVYLLTQQFDGKGNSLYIERNGSGRPTHITAPGRSVSIGIGGNGFIAEIRDELGRRVKYAYNSEGRLSHVTAADGGTTGYTYQKPPPPLQTMVSAAGGGSSGGGSISVISSIGPGADGPVYISSMTFPGVAEPLHLEYGKSFRVLRQTLGNQMELRFSYVLSGTCAIHQSNLHQRPLSCAGPNGPSVETWDLDQAGWHFFGGQVTATRVTDANGNGFTVRFNSDNLGIELADAKGQITSYERDARNRITAVTDPLGRTTSYQYDGNSNITRIVEPTGRTTDLGYDPKWNKVASIIRTLDDGTPVTYRFEYDQLELGLLLRAIDPLGNVTEYGYTDTARANNLIDQVTDPLGRITRLGYSDRGDLTSVTDPLGNSVSLQHDALGRLLQVTDALGATTRSDYNTVDQITRILDANGGQTGFSYDGKRDPKSVVDPLDRAVESYVTDALHRLTRRTDAAGADETYEYDRAGRLVSAVDRKGQQVRLAYDRLDRVTRIEYADGNVETREYDAVSRLVRISDAAGTVAFDYDELDRLVKETTEHDGVINSVEYRYDALDRLVERTVNGADPTSYSYDLASRLLSIEFRGTTVTYEWDEASRLTAKTLPNGTRQEYLYDVADRLTEIRFVRSDDTLIERIAYQYDANGRRIGKSTSLPSNDETLITGTYDDANRMTSVTFTNSGESCALDYDTNGNLTVKTCPGGVTLYTWDAQDRLIAIDGPGLAASFRYDALGRRIERSVNGDSTGYLYDGVQAIAEFGAEDAALLSGLAIDEALGRFAGSGDLTLLTDALGSVVAEARGDESIATRYGYSPYGETVSAGEESGSSTRYTGREEDGTGLYYYRARYFSPSLKRFFIEDPPHTPKQYTFYGLGNGNPIMSRDPLGLYVEVLVRPVASPFTAWMYPTYAHCSIRFNGNDTDAWGFFGRDGGTFDRETNLRNAVYIPTIGPENDKCVKDWMQRNCPGQYSLLAFNCCHCIRGALRACDLRLAGNWPFNPLIGGNFDPDPPSWWARGQYGYMPLLRRRF
ncbi:MAG: IPT/TIG domain-containing protein [Gammaproteobacteria bacterium]|nr:IPT/TIG domain-containing protein [Gammaproteobacteria bacterium]